MLLMQHRWANWYSFISINITLRLVKHLAYASKELKFELSFYVIVFRSIKSCAVTLLFNWSRWFRI